LPWLPGGMCPGSVGSNSVVIVPRIRSILPRPRGYPANPTSEWAPGLWSAFGGWWSVAALLGFQSAELFFVAADVAGDRDQDRDGVVHDQPRPDLLVDVVVI
jgi:hypothetical protein